MDIHEEDTNQSFRVILFIILISLFAFTFTGKSNCQDSNSFPISLQNESTIRYDSGHDDAVIFQDAAVQVFIETGSCNHHNTSLNLFDFQYKIIGYNRQIAHNIIFNRNAWLVIEPLSLRIFRFHTILNPGEELPVLS